MSSYKGMEEVLKKINQKFITLKNSEVAHNNKLLESTIQRMTRLLRDDPLFETLYQNLYYGGSYYDDLKVGQPDEFDLDFLFVIPKHCEINNTRSCSCVEIVPADIPMFFWFKIKENHCGKLNKYIKEGYLQTNLILNWLQGLVYKALNKFSDIDFMSRTPTYYSQSGPALTLRLFGEFGQMDVDIVPAFKFESWPSYPYRMNSTSKISFFLVPKKAKTEYYAERYWRTSFQDQEREMIRGKEKLKPAIRLLKKMRNNLDHKSISSYALKTIALWELEEVVVNKNETLAGVFMKLLKRYKTSLDNGVIFYYWNKDGNLLYEIKKETLENHHNEIRKKINEIETKYKADPTVIAKIILKEGSQEYKLFMSEWLGENSSSTPAAIQPLTPNESGLTQRTESLSIGGIVGLGVAAAIIGGIGLFTSILTGRTRRDT